MLIIQDCFINNLLKSKLKYKYRSFVQPIKMFDSRTIKTATDSSTKYKSDPQTIKKASKWLKKW